MAHPMLGRMVPPSSKKKSLKFLIKLSGRKPLTFPLYLDIAHTIFSFLSHVPHHAIQAFVVKSGLSVGCGGTCLQPWHFVGGSGGIGVS